MVTLLNQETIQLFNIFVYTGLLFLHFLLASYSVVKIISFDKKISENILSPVTEKLYEEFKKLESNISKILLLLIFSGIFMIIYGFYNNPSYFENDKILFKLFLVIVISINGLIFHILTNTIQIGESLYNNKYIEYFKICAIISSMSWVWACFIGIARAWDNVVPFNEILFLYVFTLVLTYVVISILNKKGNVMTKTTFTFALIGVVAAYTLVGLTYFIMNFAKSEDIIRKIVEGKAEQKVEQKITEEKEKIKEKVKEKVKEVVDVVKKVEPPKTNVINDVRVPEEREVRKVIVKDTYNSWAYNLTKIDLSKIEKSNYDVVVIDTERKENRPFTKKEVESLKTKPDGSRRKVIAFVSLGQVERFRSYWKPEWAGKKPSWIGNKSTVWRGVYEINDLKDKEWISVSKSIIDKTMKNGFDGIMIGGLGFHKNKEDAAFFIKVVSNYAKLRNDKFLIFSQDTDELVKYEDYVNSIDGIVRQSVYYEMLSGKNRSNYYRNVVNKRLKELKAKNKHVFIIEYVDGKKWNSVEKEIESNGFIGFNSNVRLDKI